MTTTVELLKAISSKCFEAKKRFVSAPGFQVPMLGPMNDLADSIIHIMAEFGEDGPEE